VVCSISALFWAKWSSDTGQEIMNWAETYYGQSKENIQNLVVTVVGISFKMGLRQTHLGNGTIFLSFQ
jgi:hypothetical protein